MPDRDFRFGGGATRRLRDPTFARPPQWRSDLEVLGKVGWHDVRRATVENCVRPLQRSRNQAGADRLAVEAKRESATLPDLLSIPSRKLARRLRSLKSDPTNNA